MFFLSSVRVAPGSRLALAMAGSLALSASQGVVHADEVVAPVVVTATRQPIGVSDLLHDVTVLDRQDIERAAASTLQDVLARQPGIQISTNGGPGALSSVFIRGTNSNHLVLLIDGMRVSSLTGGSPNWSRIPVAQIHRIEIVRGPVSSLYGSDAIGGVIQVFTREGRGPAQWSAELGLGSQGTAKANVGVAGGHQGWRYALNVGTEHTDGINASPRSTVQADQDRDGYHARNASGRLSYALTADTELGGTWLYSHGINRYDRGEEQDYRARASVSTAGMFINSRVSPAWSTKFRVSRSDDNARQFNSVALSSLEDSRQTEWSWQNDIQSSVGTWLLGLERLDESLDASSTYVKTDRAVNSALAGWRLTYGAHTVQANARHDDSTQYGHRSTGSMAYGYRMAPSWRAHMSYGTAFKAPTFADLYFPLECYDYPDFPDWSGCYGGNPNLKPESSRNREISLHYEERGHHASLTWYLNHVDNLIQWSKTPENVASARLEGMTLAYAGHVGRWDLSASWDHLHAKNMETGLRLLKRARNQGTLTVGRDWNRWAGRVEVQAGSNRVDFSQKPMAGYALVNVYGTYQASRDWQVFTRVNNLFNQHYVLSYGFATPGINTFIGVRYTPR